MFSCMRAELMKLKRLYLGGFPILLDQHRNGVRNYLQNVDILDSVVQSLRLPCFIPLFLLPLLLLLVPTSGV